MRLAHRTSNITLLVRYWEKFTTVMCRMDRRMKDRSPSRRITETSSIIHKSYFQLCLRSSIDHEYVCNCNVWQRSRADTATIYNTNQKNKSHSAYGVVHPRTGTKIRRTCVETEQRSETPTAFHAFIRNIEVRNEKEGTTRS